MRYLIDTNCCIYLFADAYPRLTERVRATQPGMIGLSTTAMAELLVGAARDLLPDAEAVTRLARAFPPVSFDEAAARAFGRLPSRRGNFDRLIAAHALSLDLTLISRDGAFADVPGLRVEDWTR